MPLKVWNRLRAGNDVAAEIPPSREGFRAWIHVKPILDPHHVVRLVFGTGEGVVRSSDGQTNWHYFVRRVEMRETYLQYMYESDYYMQDETTISQLFFAATENEVEILLSKWLSDFTKLTIPGKVLCPHFLEGMGGPPLRVINLRNQMDS